MNISSFFVDRPIFASVLSVFLVILGLLSLNSLPIAEYPEVSPPSIVVRAQYPGANPKVISETVATPLEEQINGVENMLYLSSQATTDGSLSITVTFKLGTDADRAQQLVENRVNQALPRLPDDVRRFGVTTTKRSGELTLVVHLLSPDNRYDTLYLRNYAVMNIRDRLTRIRGVGDVVTFGGGDYAMRVWLNPELIAARNLTATDVVRAIREQNTQVAAGMIGGQPSGNDIAFQLPVNAQGRLQTADEFKNIIIKATPTGVVHLKDVARVELAASEYALRSLLDNKPASALAIFQTPNSNAIQISDDVRAAMAELKKTFPEGMDYKIVHDPTRFVRTSITSVIHTLLEATLLVVLVVIVFLQTWRASIIPLLAVPISVIGTFLVLHLLGFSINNLTLFGLVLAIGIVVDDAIVVVENVERNIEEGLSPREATYKAMREVSEPIIAIALTLCAVFVPIAFISGLTGQFYRQFATTIAISTVISAFNSLTLSPALAALLLKEPHHATDRLSRGMDKYFGRFFDAFNRFFHSASTLYHTKLRAVIGHRSGALIVYAILIFFSYLGFAHTPRSYVPLQDKEYLVAFAQLPSGASLERTEAIIRQISDVAGKHPGVLHAIAFPGLSVAGFSSSSNSGIVFIRLKPFEERRSADLYGPSIAQQLMGQLMAVPDAFIGVFPPPAVQGLGTIGGFKVQVQDRANLGHEALYGAVQAVIGKSYQTPQLSGVFSTYDINVPQLYANLDRERAKKLGINITDVFDTMQTYLGSLYVNDFNQFGRTYRVIAQADAPYRSHAEDILQLKTRNAQGEMIPLGSVLNVEQSYGPDRVTRYNLYRAADINGSPAAGVSSGEAQAAMEKILADTLPQGISYEWTDLTYQQILAGNAALWIFPLCVLFVFLVLAAQYESLILPLVIILIVPVVLFCAIAGVTLAGNDNNIFTQIGLVVLVGLACKNAILIVEFARELEHQGKSTIEAALDASRLRLRPILMTSLAFIMGVLPLVFSSGAGAEMRNAIGVTVFAGMLGVTFFGLFLTPMFYVLLRSISKKWTGET